ncbi:hypothetical protein N7528_004043 [Penicillium herquei]|nr:hypothetical protein N7528_004043 [Penicillium herquei]
MESFREARTAPTYHLPSRRLVSVEHPAVIRNLDKAVDTLGGNAGINTFMNPRRPDTAARLVLRPEDALSRPLMSTSSATNNLLLKITVPKRTGRKRKRGSNDPFTDPAPGDTSDSQRQSSKELMRCLRDNPSKYKIEPIGKVGRTHVFRHMPEFVHSTTSSVFTQKFRDHIIPYNLEKLKGFDIDMAKGATKNADLIPPPSLSNERIPFFYMYRQNPGVKQTMGESGQMITVNTQQAEKVRTHLISHDVTEVPSKPQESLPPIDTLDVGLRATIDLLRELFDRRPAWTRRAIRNHLQSDEQRYLLRLAIPYVGYIFRAGPWRDAIVKLGIDPRTDPKYREYQTFMFRLLPREAELDRDSGSRRNPWTRLDPEVLPFSENRDSYIFTGNLPIRADGRIWMICDIVDPLIRGLLFPSENKDPRILDHGPHLRETCESVSDGWFGNGLLAKVKVIMRTKIAALIDGLEPTNDDFWTIANFPNFVETETEIMTDCQLDPRTSSPKEVSLATEIRAVIRSSPIWARGTGRATGTSKNPRVGKRQAATTPKKRKAVEQDREEDMDDMEQSEGEEEEMERAEMVAAALAAREAAEDEVNDVPDGDEDDEDEDEDESESDEDEDEDDYE